MLFERILVDCLAEEILTDCPALCVIIDSVPQSGRSSFLFDAGLCPLIRDKSTAGFWYYDAWCVQNWPLDEGGSGY